MKIIGKDNFDRENYADKLIAEGVSEYFAPSIAEFLQGRFGGNDASYFFTAVPDDYKLWRGMEELI